MNKVKLYWSLQLGGWVAFAFAQTIGFLFFGRTPSNSQTMFLFVEAGLFFMVTHLFRTFIIKQGWLALGMARLIPRVLVSILFMAIAIYFIRMLPSIPLGQYNERVAWNPTNIIGLTTAYAFILFFWSVIYFIYHYFERYNLSLKHEAAVHEIELNNLKSQLNPHFIFNALNSIRALVDENPVKSKNAITQLSNILRNSLVSDKKRLTKFENELRTVKDYLSLESIRFEERLKTKFEIHPDSYQFYVPPLMLQTLVENGVKHGISKLKEGGSIQLKTYVSEKHLKIQIRNSGHYDLINGTDLEDKAGLGIKNTKQRLSLIYGDQAGFKIFNESENIVLTELVIPQNK